LNSARVFTPDNHLARLLRPGAPTATELLADADSRLTALAGTIRIFISNKLTEILPFAEQTDDVLFAECRDIAGIAMNIAEVAGAAGLEALGDVARGIYVMIDGLVSLGVWHTDALRLHIRSLSLLSPDAGPSTAQDERRIVENLRLMREAIGLKS
jgi:hypothetical protein